MCTLWSLSGPRPCRFVGATWHKAMIMQCFFVFFCLFVFVCLFVDVLQLYSATFEAIAEGSQAVKTKGLTFELQGEGNLPQVALEKPVLHNAQGQPLLLFKRLMVGHTQTLPVVVRNVGTIQATLVLAVSSGHESFSVVQPKGLEEEEEEEVMGKEDNKVDGVCLPGAGPGTKQAPPPPTLVTLGLDETKELNVLFQPANPDKCTGELQLKIQDNQFENLRMVLLGEGYKDDVGIDCIQSVVDEGVDSVSGEESVDTMQGKHLSSPALQHISYEPPPPPPLFFFSLQKLISTICSLVGVLLERASSCRLSYLTTL